MVINQELIDDVLVTLGELNAERWHRKEGERTVTVKILGCEGYLLTWHVGNKLDITSNVGGVIGSLYLNQFNSWTRYTAVSIAGIILSHSEMWKRLNGGISK